MLLTRSNHKHKSKAQTLDSARKGERHDFALRFEAIGTHWEIEVFNTLVNDTVVEQAVAERIAVFDKNYSRFRADSLVTKLSQQTGVYILPADAKLMLDTYYDLYKLTNGLMTPLIGQTLSDAGYDAHYTLQPKTVRQPPKWEDCLDYAFPKLTIKKPVLLDFGALGKGYLVDIVGELLTSLGCTEFIINAGGDILHRGLKPVEIALENPLDTTEAVGIASLFNRALCGSAGNRRAWADYNHVLNPSTLQSPTHIAAVWVCADTTLLADALTTALYFVTPAKLALHYTFSYSILTPNFSLTASPNFTAQFFNAEPA